MAFKYNITYEKRNKVKTKEGKCDTVEQILRKFGDCRIIEIDISKIKEPEYATQNR